MMATTNSPNLQENSSNMCCDDEYLKTHIPEGCPITYHLGMNLLFYYSLQQFMLFKCQPNQLF